MCFFRQARCHSVPQKPDAGPAQGGVDFLCLPEMIKPDREHRSSKTLHLCILAEGNLPCQQLCSLLMIDDLGRDIGPTKSFAVQLIQAVMDYLMIGIKFGRERDLYGIGETACSGRTATNLSRGVSNSKGGTMFILFARPFPALPFSLHFREIRFKNGAHQDMRVDQPPMADLILESHSGGGEPGDNLLLPLDFDSCPIDRQQ